MSVPLETDVERIALETEDPFTIARGTTTTTENVVVCISDGDHEGIGAAAPSARYGETADTVEAVLPDLLGVVEAVGDPHNLAGIAARMDRTVRGNPAAKAAVDVALHDLVCKRLDVALYRYLGLDPGKTVTSSYTVGIAETGEMRRRAEAALEAGHDVLKVKVGTDRDLDIVGAVRAVAPDARLRVDANEAWSPREALAKIEAMADFDVEFVEQPVPADDRDGMALVYERSALPIAADEACVTLPDVPAIAGRADIATLKLMKCGGVRPALRMVHAARAHGLEVMLGCMLETDATIAAAAHLAPLVDYVDLDGSMLLADDPFDGVPMPGGLIDLGSADGPGTGAR